MNPQQFETTSRAVALVCEYFHVTTAQLESPSRERDIAWPRQIVMHLIRHHAHITNRHIGRLFSRCHATVIYSLRALNDRVQTNPADARELAHLDSILSNK